MYLFRLIKYSVFILHQLFCCQKKKEKEQKFNLNLIMITFQQVAGAG